MKKGFTQIGTSCLSIFLLSMDVLGEEFSTPRDFSEFESNVGIQKLVEVVRPWVGQTPQEIAPGSIPLGSLKNRTYVPAKKLKQDPEPLVEVERIDNAKIKASNKINPGPVKEESFPYQFQGESVPIANSAPGWVGPLPSELAPMAIPLGSLANRRFITRVKKNESAQPAEAYGEEPAEAENLLNANLFFSTRPYYTFNVLRINNGEDQAGVWENLGGASVSTKELPLGQYITLVPKIDLMMQVASYEDKDVAGINLKDLLGYRFGLLKAGLSINFPNDFSLNVGYEYNLLHSLDTGDKMFDALAPSFRLSKIFTLGETTLLMVDGSVRYSFTKRELPNPLPGQFPDDGDNLQAGLSLMLIKLFGAEGQFTIMPSVGISRSQYLNHDNKGRVDWSTTIGLSGSWQATDWLNLELGVNCSILRMNDLGQLLQGASSRYEAYDLGGTIMASHSF